MAASRVWGSIPKQSGKFAIFLSVFCYFSTLGKRHDWMDRPCFLALEANFKGWLPSVCQSLMIAAIGTMHCKFAAFLFEQHCRWWRLRFLSNFCCNGTWYHCNCSRELQHSLQPLSWAMISLQSLLQPAESSQWSFAACRCIIITLTIADYCNCSQELTVSLPSLFVICGTIAIAFESRHIIAIAFLSRGICAITIASWRFITITFCESRHCHSCSCDLQNHCSCCCDLHDHHDCSLQVVAPMTLTSLSRVAGSLRSLFANWGITAVALATFKIIAVACATCGINAVALWPVWSSRSLFGNRSVSNQFATHL